MVLKISKEPPRVSKALFRLYTDYQLFMQKCFRKDGENFRQIRSLPHRSKMPLSYLRGIFSIRILLPFYYLLNKEAEHY